MKDHLIVVLGPTAVGKTQVALSLAAAFNSEIVNADSRQIYSEMNIGTAKPTKDEQELVYHHMVSTHSVSEDYSAGQYGTDTLEMLNNLFKEKQEIIMVGGSGLYIQAVTEGLDSFPDVDPEIRNTLIASFEKEGLPYLQHELESKDPTYFKQVDINNPQRIIRALEVSIGTGKPYSSYRTGAKSKRDFNVIKIGLELDREELFDRINRRVDAMMATGLLDEVESLFEYRHTNAMNSVGYSELIQYLEGKLELDEAVDLIKQNTRRYAKRQLTWFKRDQSIKWFHPSKANTIYKYLLDEIH